MLNSSSPDKVAFTEAFWRKWGATKTAYERRRLTWSEPDYIRRALEIVLPMIQRYLAGDFRHSEAEVDAEQDLALFVVNQHRSMTKQPLLREATWPSFNRTRKRKLANASG